MTTRPNIAASALIPGAPSDPQPSSLEATAKAQPFLSSGDTRFTHPITEAQIDAVERASA